MRRRAPEEARARRGGPGCVASPRCRRGGARTRGPIGTLRAASAPGAVPEGGCPGMARGENVALRAAHEAGSGCAALNRLVSADPGPSERFSGPLRAAAAQGPEVRPRPGARRYRPRLEPGGRRQESMRSESLDLPAASGPEVTEAEGGRIEGADAYRIVVPIPSSSGGRAGRAGGTGASDRP